MALISCPECNQKISEQAHACPRCGYFDKSNQYKNLRKRTLVLVSLATLVVIGFMIKESFDAINTPVAKIGDEIDKNRGLSGVSAKNFKLEDYQQVLEEDPNNPEALSQLSKMYIDQLSYDKALPLMERLVSLQPENAFYLNELAFLYMNTGDQKKQESTYNKIIKLNPKDILALTSKAILRLEKGDRQAAKALFSKAEAVALTDETKDSIRSMAEEALSEANPNP